jgi:lipoprotein-anchoring transpeptidase ErfK/SrfK
MKNYITFAYLSCFSICSVLFLPLDNKSHDRQLYAESIDNEAAINDQLEVISREDIVFKAKTQKPEREQSLPSDKQQPRQQQTTKPRLLPVTTGTVVSGPEGHLPEGMSLAHASVQTNGSQPVKRITNRDSLQETIDNAYECLLRGKKYEARNFYSQALFMETSRERQQIIKRHLDALNKELVFSPNPGPGSTVYKVVSGDNLTKIAKKFNTTPGLILKINKKQDVRIRIDEPLKILTGTPSIVVDKSNFTLTLLIDGHFIKQYHVGTGKNNSTPEGSFAVETTLKNPIWYSPEGVYPYGHPKNILGTRWLGFQNKPGMVGYGIHGTTEPESIGTESSNGCIRMKNEDVEELYDFITPGTEVIISS